MQVSQPCSLSSLAMGRTASIPKDAIPISRLYSCRLLFSVNPISTRGVAAYMRLHTSSPSTHNESRYFQQRRISNPIVSIDWKFRWSWAQTEIQAPIARWSIIGSEEGFSWDLWQLALELTTGRVADSCTPRPPFFVPAILFFFLARLPSIIVAPETTSGPPSIRSISKHAPQSHHLHQWRVSPHLCSLPELWLISYSV